MSIKIHILASSSSGNCVALEENGEITLIDAGISYKRIRLKLEELGYTPENIKTVLLSHEHGDHIAGLPLIFKKHHPMLYTTQGTLNAIRVKEQTKGSAIIPENSNISIVKRFDIINISNFTIEVLPGVHDAAEPVCFFIKNSAMNIMYLLDTGYPTQLLKAKAVYADVLLLESNYDEDIIKKSSLRPWSNRMRVMSRYGHLSNKQAVSFIKDLLKNKENHLKTLVLMHISKEHNNREILSELFAKTFAKNNLHILLSDPQETLSL